MKYNVLVSLIVGSLLVSCSDKKENEYVQFQRELMANTRYSKLGPSLLIVSGNYTEYVNLHEDSVLYKKGYDDCSEKRALDIAFKNMKVSTDNQAVYHRLNGPHYGSLVYKSPDIYICSPKSVSSYISVASMEKVCKEIFLSLRRNKEKLSKESWDICSKLQYTKFLPSEEDVMELESHN